LTLLHPRDEADVADMVTWAAADARPLEIRGGGSKQGLGRSRRPDDVLDLSALAGVIDYAPDELVVTALAATPLGAIQRLLAQSGQMLAFDPPNWNGLLEASHAPTVAGTMACNLSGPRRVRAGAARDHLLGFRAVNGRGEVWKSGGRVVKNVTGYDLCKLQCGAMGTLSVLTEVTLRTVPRPEAQGTALVFGLSDQEACAAMTRALNAPLDVAAAAHAPGPAASRSVLAGRGPVTALRLEGHAPSVAFRLKALQDLLGSADSIEGPVADRFWADVASVHPLLHKAERVIWRVNPIPSKAAECAGALGRLIPETEVFYDWGGGLIWLSLPLDKAGADGGARAVRGQVDLVGGHATLIAAPAVLRDAAPAFPREAPAVSALSGRIKAGFDPLRILNPGRLHEDR